MIRPTRNDVKVVHKLLSNGQQWCNLVAVASSGATNDVNDGNWCASSSGLHLDGRSIIAVTMLALHSISLHLIFLFFFPVTLGFSIYLDDHSEDSTAFSFLYRPNENSSSFMTGSRESGRRGWLVLTSRFYLTPHILNVVLAKSFILWLVEWW